MRSHQCMQKSDLGVDFWIIYHSIYVIWKVICNSYTHKQWEHKMRSTKHQAYWVTESQKTMLYSCSKELYWMCSSLLCTHFTKMTWYITKHTMYAWSKTYNSTKFLHTTTVEYLHDFSSYYCSSKHKNSTNDC